MTNSNNPDSSPAVPLAINPDNLDSPCIGICSTLFDEVCQGCGRTALEVCNWVFMTPEEKHATWTRITHEATAMRFVRKN
ncbi:MAG: hypothetical protein RLZZ472_1314 [Pseudomonadota bacterium]